MSLVFQAILEFLGMAIQGRDSPFAFHHRPLWQRIPLILLTVVLLVVVAGILTIVVLGVGAFMLGIFRGVSS